MKKTLVSVVIPSYNERENLLVLIPKIIAVFRKLPSFQHEIIVVDDNSPDGTAEAVRRKFRNPVYVMNHRGTRDLGRSIAQGIYASHGDILIGMDADGNHDPACIPRLLDRLRSEDLVVASRFVRGGGMADRARFIGSALLNAVFCVVLGFPVRDNTSGFYAIRKKQLRLLGVRDIYYGYGEYHVRLVWRAKQHGLTLAEVPVFYASRRHGESKSRLFAMIVPYCMAAVSLRLLHGRRNG